MILKEFPSDKELKQLKRANASSYWHKIGLILSFLLLLFFSWQILGTFSQPAPGGAGITATGTTECDAVKNMTAYQCDFRYGGQNIGQPDDLLNVKGAKSAEVGGTGLNLGAASPGDAQLPFNVFFPGRGQKDPQDPKYLLLGMEISPGAVASRFIFVTIYKDIVTWKFNNSPNGGIPSTIVGDAANVPSVQRINAEMLDSIWGTTQGWHRQRGYNGIVFGNDVNINGNGPQIVVARFKYDTQGNAKIEFPLYDVRIFYINSATYTLASDNRVQWYENRDPNKCQWWPGATWSGKYPGGLGRLHDVHLVRTSTGGYKFIVTIIDGGVLELTPTGGSNLSCTWNYLMPNLCKWYAVKDLGGGNWTYEDKGYISHRERPTTWYAQPIDNGNGLWDVGSGSQDSLLISIGPWKSYKDNGILTNTFRSFSVGGNTYNPSGYPATNNDPAVYVAWTGLRQVRIGDHFVIHEYTKANGQPKWQGNLVPCFLGMDGKIWANNTNYMMAGAGSCPPDNRPSPPNPPCPPLEEGDKLDAAPLINGPRIFDYTRNWNWAYRTVWWPPIPPFNYPVSGQPPDPGGYSETLFQLPQQDYFFVNMYDWRVNTYELGADNPYQGYPAIVKREGTGDQQQTSLVWKFKGDAGKPSVHPSPYAYVHMGAGTYAAYGTKRPESWDSDIVNKKLDAITDMRDGGLASQLAPPPDNSYVRDFEFMRTRGSDTKYNANLFGQSQLAYALADENKNIFRSPKGPRNNPNNPLNFANVDIDLNNLTESLMNEGKDLKDYQQIWLAALMWGDVGSGLNQFQRSNTPVLHAWGISYKDKTARFAPTLTAITGKDPDPRNYTSDGASQFYTGKEHNQVRYKLRATNDNGDITWPANNLRVTSQLSDKETFTGNNKVYYRIKPKTPPSASPLIVWVHYNASSSQCRPNPAACHPLKMIVKVNGQRVHQNDLWVDNPIGSTFTFPNAFPTTNDKVEIEFASPDRGDLVVEKIRVNRSDYSGTIDVPWNQPGSRYYIGACPSFYFNPGECKNLCDTGPRRCWQNGIMAWLGHIEFPTFDSSLWKNPSSVSYSGGNGGQLTITLPAGEVVNQGDTLEVIYTTTIRYAGKISHKATLGFNNRGNSISAPGVSASCTGNAPWVQTLYGDVYMGGCPTGSQCFPYQAYGNATFLIQSNGSIAPYFSSQKGWIQPNYPIKGSPLEFTNVKDKVIKEVTKLKDNMRKVSGGPTWGNRAKISPSDIANSKIGIWATGVVELQMTGNFPNNMGPKLLVVENGMLGFTGSPNKELLYDNQSVSDPKDLASLGVVLINSQLHIGAAVQKLVGAYFVDGTIITCNYWEGYKLPGGPGLYCNNSLTVYGLMVAKDFVLARTWTDTSTPPSPAEKIIYDGRVALNPPPGFSDFGKLLPVWKEVAP